MCIAITGRARTTFPRRIGAPGKAPARTASRHWSKRGAESRLNSGGIRSGVQILSEFYHLRRTAIKDLAAYIGFLVGFIGVAPFAWGLLGEQLASGEFVRGLWYFFGIVIAAGIFTGTAGLGVGYVAGLVWEHTHRHLRSEKLKAKALADTSPMNVPRESDASSPPKLSLVPSAEGELPNIAGRRLDAVRFGAVSIELSFGGSRLTMSGNPVVLRSGQRFRYPDAGTRDALCALIGDRVERVRAAGADRVEVSFESGAEIIIARTSVAVA